MGDNKKIVFIIGSLVRGGAEKIIVTLAERYASQGCDVTIIMLLFNKISFCLDPRIKIIDMTGKTPSRILRVLFWVRSLHHFFKINQPDCIVSFVARINVLTLLAAGKLAPKVIVSERNDPRYDGRGLLIKKMTYILYPKSKAIVFQTKEVQKMFPSKIQQKSIVLPNPIQIFDFADADSFNPNLIITTGRLARQKNQIVAIKSMSYVVKKFPDMRLEIYGDGDLGEFLQKEIVRLGLTNNVFVYPNESNVQNKVLHSWLFVFTSLYEGMSNSLMEACLSGVPCVSTRCLGTDVISEGLNGFFIPFNDEVALSKIIITLKSDESLYASLRMRAIECAKNHPCEDTAPQWDHLVLD